MSITRAACVTPPGVGGIAVIQVVGDAAVALVSRHLRKGDRPLDLAALSPDQLKLCQVIEGPDVLDDAVVCARQVPGGPAIVDLNLHGGPRVVQRVLLMLQREGTQIVEAADLPTACWQAATLVEQDALAMLPLAQTRRAAVWLGRLGELLAHELRRVRDLIEHNHPQRAREALALLLEAAPRTILFIRGIRVVLVGAPNSGKSTLANALAQREHAIVSHTPGTTRDWTEHPAAIEGVPVNVVDTAGLRETADPIEQEAIRRAIEQCGRADVLVRVTDQTAPQGSPGERHVDQVLQGRTATPIVSTLSKCDLSPSAGVIGITKTDEDGPTLISARTGEGLDRLRARILEAAGVGAAPWPTAPFTESQTHLLRQAYEALGDGPDDRTLAAGYLEKLIRPSGTAGSEPDQEV